MASWTQDLCSPWMEIWGDYRESGEEGRKGTHSTDLTKNTIPLLWTLVTSPSEDTEAATKGPR